MRARRPSLPHPGGSSNRSSGDPARRLATLRHGELQRVKNRAGTGRGSGYSLPAPLRVCGKEISRVAGKGTSVLTISPDGPLRGSVATFGALVASGFRRYTTYRQATIAGTFTNVVFGYLRCYVLLAVVAGAAGGRPGGYDAEQLVTYVWL